MKRSGAISCKLVDTARFWSINDHSRKLMTMIIIPKLFIMTLNFFQIANPSEQQKENLRVRLKLFTFDFQDFYKVECRYLLVDNDFNCEQ